MPTSLRYPRPHSYLQSPILPVPPFFTSPCFTLKVIPYHPPPSFPYPPVSKPLPRVLRGWLYVTTHFPLAGNTQAEKLMSLIGRRWETESSGLPCVIVLGAGSKVAKNGVRLKLRARTLSGFWEAFREVRSQRPEQAWDFTIAISPKLEMFSAGGRKMYIDDMKSALRLIPGKYFKLSKAGTAEFQKMKDTESWNSHGWPYIPSKGEFKDEQVHLSAMLGRQPTFDKIQSLIALERIRRGRQDSAIKRIMKEEGRKIAQAIKSLGYITQQRSEFQKSKPKMIKGVKERKIQIKTKLTSMDSEEEFTVDLQKIFDAYKRKSLKSDAIRDHTIQGKEDIIENSLNQGSHDQNTDMDDMLQAWQLHPEAKRQQ